MAVRLIGVESTLPRLPDAVMKATGPFFDVMTFGATGNGTTDDGPAIQAAIDEAYAAEGGVVFFPQPATFYNIATSLELKRFVHFLGAGNRGGFSVKVETANTDIFFAPLAGPSIFGVIIEGFSFRSKAGGGHIFSMQGSNISVWSMRDCYFQQDNDAKSVMDTSGGDAIELHVTNFLSMHKNTATVPSWNMVSAHNAINCVSWTKGRFQYSGEYCIHIENTSTSYCQDINISDINFEQCLGGEVRLLSCRTVTVARCWGYDATTYANDRYYVGKSATGATSTGIKFDQVVRRGGALAGGVVDIRMVASESSRATILGCNGQIDTGGVSGVAVFSLDTSTPAGALAGTLSENAMVHENGTSTARNTAVAGTAGSGYTQWTARQSVTPTTPAANAIRQFSRTTSSKWEMAFVDDAGVVGRFETRIVAVKTSNYALANEDVVIFNGTSISCTIPSAVNRTDRIYTIKNINATALTVATALSGTETVDGVIPGPLAQWGVMRIISDGTNWLTLGNYHRGPRVGTVASSATPTINTNHVDHFRITALAAAVTDMSTNLTGTPVDGQKLHISITDNGTARALTWGATFEASTVPLPTTTVISTRLDVDFIWNTVTSKWRCLQVA